MLWPNPLVPVVACGAPDFTFEATTADLYEDSWDESLPRLSNPREQITFPRSSEQEWASLLVRTAVVRPSSWKEGVKGPALRAAGDVAVALVHLPLLDHERTVVLSLDDDYRLIAIHEASVGGLHSCAMTPTDIVRVPVLVGASKVVVVHNHPSGDPTPSQADVQMARRVFLSAQSLGIHLVDSLVLSRTQGYRSVAQAAEGTQYEIPGYPAADRTFKAKPTNSEQAALKPYGRLAKFVVRTALVESPGYESQYRPTLNSPQSVAESPFVRKLRSEPDETLLTFCLDGRGGVMAAHVTRGAVHGIEARAVYAVAALVPTSGIILVHNHPDQHPIDPADRVMTKDLHQGLEAIGTQLLDHVIVSGGRTDSMQELGII